MLFRVCAECRTQSPYTSLKMSCGLNNGRVHSGLGWVWGSIFKSSAEENRHQPARSVRAKCHRIREVAVSCFVLSSWCSLRRDAGISVRAAKGPECDPVMGPGKETPSQTITWSFEP